MVYNTNFNLKTYFEETLDGHTVINLPTPTLDLKIMLKYKCVI